MRTVTQLLLALTALVLMNGCTAAKRVSPVSNTFLTDVDINKQLKNMPFDHSWVWKAVDRKQYTAVYFPPVKIDTLPDNAWQSSVSPFVTSRADYDERAADIGEYFRARLIEEFRKDPASPLLVADRPGPGVAVFQLAFTELEFSHPIARAGALAAPIPGTGPALSTVTDPHVAFAARMYDPQTGTLFATAADRKFPPTRIIDLNKLTVQSSAREVVSLWAEEIAEAIHKGRFGEVENRGRFAILPW